MPSWPSKDPETVADYRYNVALDPEDALDSITIAVVSGTVEIDSDSDDAGGITAWLSGGTDGETAVFKVEWTTDDGRTFDDIITMPVAANELAALALTGYAKPTAAHLIARYPAFAAVSVATIRAWLTDAERFVDNTWIEGDYAPAIMAYAAHQMTLQGLGTATGAAAIPAGVTRFKSAQMDVSISDKAASLSAGGGYGSTLYGREFARLLRRSHGGPQAVGTGTAPPGVYAP